MIRTFGKYCLIKVVYLHLHSIEWTAPIEYIQNDDEIPPIDIIQSTRWYYNYRRSQIIICKFGYTCSSVKNRNF